MNKEIRVLDHGLVRLVSYMQPVAMHDFGMDPKNPAGWWNGDLEAVRNARVSYDAEWRAGEDEGKDAKLIGELGAVLARISIQGIDAIDPSSGKTNRQRLHEETADVIAQINCNMAALGMDVQMIEERVKLKVGQMAEWEAHYV